MEESSPPNGQQVTAKLCEIMKPCHITDDSTKLRRLFNNPDLFFGRPGQRPSVPGKIKLHQIHDFKALGQFAPFRDQATRRSLAGQRRHRTVHGGCGLAERTLIEVDNQVIR
jgi:hypothetical protein